MMASTGNPSHGTGIGRTLRMTAPAGRILTLSGAQSHSFRVECTPDMPSLGSSSLSGGASKVRHDGNVHMREVAVGEDGDYQAQSHYVDVVKRTTAGPMPPGRPP